MILRSEIDRVETDKEYVVEAELPGVPKENLDIQVTLLLSFQFSDLSQVVGDNTLVLSGHQESKEKEGERELSFKRMVSLDTKIDPNTISAKLKDGVLKVTVPKEEVPMKKIDVIAE